MRANHLECAFPLVLNRRSFLHPFFFPQIPSLRSERFQSSYSAKFGAGAKKKWKGEGEGRRIPLPLHSFFCSRSSFLDELARNRLLRRLPNSLPSYPLSAPATNGSADFLPSERSLSLTKQDGGKIYLPWGFMSLQFRLRTFPRHMIDRLN